MPSRTFYLAPRPEDYLVFAKTYLAEEFFDAERFIDKYKLPYISDSQHVAYYVGISPSLIRQILHRPSFHYSIHPVAKKSGGFRVISAPRSYLKAIQWWILDNILKGAPDHECIHGFRIGRSYISNAKLHSGAKHLLNVDILNFFDNITDLQVFEQFLRLGYDGGGAKVLSNLTTLHGCAPTGAPTSPKLGNLVLLEFDAAIAAMAAGRGMKYTRYADDITISSQTRIEFDVLDFIKKQLNRFGFSLNEEKSKFMGRGERMEVTGLNINSGVTINREWRNKVRGILHRAELNPANFLDKRNQINGMLGLLVSVDPERRRRLTRKCIEVLNLFPRDQDEELNAGR